MGVAADFDLVSIEDYLAGELVSTIKHEYLGGVVHAMAGASASHNMAVGNIFAALHSGLKGRLCRPFNSDMKMRIQTPFMTRFYYPDVSVVCRPNPPDSSYQDEPVVVVEVLSHTTRRADEGEKKDAYLMIPSLRVLMLVDTDQRRVRIYRRGAQGFVTEQYTAVDAVIPLPEVETELALVDIYENVVIGPEEAPSDEV
ncbi:MAG: Uma2 family endonuclease [Verrucomicrobiales bacterium]|nr:Uma2 family endonuclease [Verrucomicrobiales bacterium]MCP5559480.1 Uma2 family endonuclease [Verrucomicrobiaceae bacterium]